MPDRFDIALEMVAACRGRPDAWDFLRRFTELWATRLDESRGCDDQGLTAAEHRLGLTLPAAVREGYALLGRRDDLTSNQDTLLRPDQLHFDEKGQALVFRVENQAVTYWGIAAEDLRLDDPPVIFQFDAPRGAPQPWRRFLDRFSLACVEMVLTEHRSDHHDNRESDQAALGLLERHYTRLAMPDYPMSAGPEEPEVGALTALRVRVGLSRNCEQLAFAAARALPSMIWTEALVPYARVSRSSDERLRPAEGHVRAPVGRPGHRR